MTCAGLLLELALGLGHQRRSPAEAQPDRLHVDFAGADVRMIQDRVVHRRHAVEEPRLDLLDGLQEVADVTRIRHERQRIGPDEGQRLYADVARRRERAAAEA